MKAEKIISHSCAVLLITSSIALAFIQVLDIDNVASGTLMYIAQAFLLAGSIFGLDYYIQKFSAIIGKEKRDATKAVVMICLIASMTPADAQTIKVKYPTFTSWYNLKTQTPSQVTWTLHESDLGTIKRVPSWPFRPDVPDTMAVARSADYAASGFDRGHLCPAADRSLSVDSMRSTFVMSNIAPQVPSLNRQSWLTSERFCRLAAQLYDSVQVICFPVFLDRDTVTIGAGHVAVPHAFIKACWIAKNDSILITQMFWNYERKENYPQGNKK